MTPATLRRLIATGLLALLPVVASAQTLIVSAAASLSEAFREIAAGFEASRPGVTVRLNLASSGVLVQQILQGAPVDVFASADQETMDRGVQAKGVDPATRRDFAANTLVMIAPLQSSVPLSGLADLARPDVRRVAMGKQATTPVGRYTQQALEAAGQWGAVQPKVVYADNVRQILDYVARGEVEAGFAYRTDALLMPGRVKVVLTAGGHAPVTYPVAVVADSRQPALARAFTEFLFSPTAQGILQRYGFGQP